MRGTMSVVAAVWATSATAAPIELSWQGRVLGADGDPLSGAHDLTITLHDAASGGDLLWTRTYTAVPVDDGFVSLVLTGGTPTLDSDLLLAEPAVYLQTAIGVTALGPRQALLRAPRAAVADAVRGSVTLGADSGDCVPSDPNTHGALAWISSKVQVCTATGWKALDFEPVVKTVQLVSGSRRWSDGTFARRCEEYIRPTTGYSYAGDVGDGLYRIDPDGPSTGVSAFDAWCDMSTDTGGWTLVVAYNHVGGTNPARSNAVPTSPTGSLSGALPGNLGFTTSTFADVRFYCHTSAHARVIHFKTQNAQVKQQMVTGSWAVSASSWNSGYTALAGHSANLPGATSSVHGSGDVMGDFPFYVSSTYHWAINGSGRWECDDYPNGSQHTTRHQIWVR
jgi:hypothetical protein